MALQKDITLDNGLDAPSAYHKVTDFTVSSRQADPIVADVRVTSCKDEVKAAVDGAPLTVRRYQIPFDPADNTQSPYSQVYVALKTLPDFQGSVDV